MGSVALRAALARVMSALLLALLAARALSAPASAAEIEFKAHAVARDILALYDSRHEKAPDETRIHHFAEMPLNFLGYRLTYRDVNGVLPGPDQIGGYRGILTWFAEPLADRSAYLIWLDAVMQRGVKLALLSEIAEPETPAGQGAARRILGRLGLEPTDQYVGVTSSARIIELDHDMVGFERPIDKVLPDFPLYLAVGDRTRVHFSIETPARFGRQTAALVTTNAAGGYAADAATIYYEPSTDRVAWVLNPFTFFKAAFGAEIFPIPDVTTLSGRRIYFSHIDGDGWNNLTEIEEYRAAPTSSAEVIAREAIEPYPDLPVTVGLITGDIDAGRGGTSAFAKVARHLFSLPQVEVGSHTYTHPFEWSFFEHYNRAAEQARVDQVQRPSVRLVDQIKGLALSLAGGSPPNDPSNRYVAGSSDLPRTYLKFPFDLDEEIKGSLAAAESLAPPGKKAKLMQWSGDTLPFAAAVRATRAAHVRNINGGDSRFDKEFPSALYVPPIARPVGKERQIYAGNSNENTYTNDWTGPYSGFFALGATLDNTERPRRLKPFNLYYHMYSGEKPAALAALKHHLERARHSEVAPIAASDYAAIADDFFGVEVEQVDFWSWIIKTRGEVQTVRFDAADDLALDVARSSGVLGTNRHAGSLYVALDPAVAPVRVTLMPRGRGALHREGDTPPSLVHSRWSYRDLHTARCSFSVLAQGFGPGDMLWRTLPGRKFKVVARRSEVYLAEIEVEADGDGNLRLALGVSAIEPLRLSFSCHD